VTDSTSTPPSRSRGSIVLIEDKCTVCMLCARECPDWCIHIEGHKETVPATEPRGRDRQVNVLDRFAIDFSTCMFCSICIDVCPFDALAWSPDYRFAGQGPTDLLIERGTLSTWGAALDEQAAPSAD